jgi:hypothetical protein
MQAESTNQAVAGGTDSRRTVDALRIGKATGFTWCILVVFLAIMDGTSLQATFPPIADLALQAIWVLTGLIALATLVGAIQKRRTGAGLLALGLLPLAYLLFLLARLAAQAIFHAHLDQAAGWPWSDWVLIAGPMGFVYVLMAEPGR